MTIRRKQEGVKEKQAEDLLRAAGGTAPQARPGFEEASWHRIQGRLSAETEAGRRDTGRITATRHRARWAVLVPAATLVLMMLFTTGAFAFSRDAAPDSSLYGTKLFFERARVAFTGSSAARADYQLELVRKRLNELEDLVSRGSGRGGARWEAAYRNNVDKLYAEIMELEEGHREEMLQYAAGLLEEQAEAMSGLHTEAPGGLTPNIEEARNCGMGTVECMRGQCRQQGGGEGGDGGSCPGKGGNSDGNDNGNGGGDGNGSPNRT